MNKREIICYETDASQLNGKAEKVIFPSTIEEVQEAIKNSDNLVIRGGGTGVLGGCIPNGSIIIDMNKMNRIINFDKKKDIIYVEAGISIKELNEKLESIGFEFPIIPLNEASTLGGMTALNISCPRSMRYGRMKDWIESIEFVNGRGELIKTSKTDLMDVCGMEGITGIIVRLKLKVKPKNERSISIFQSDNLDEILRISRRLKMEKEVVMLEIFSKKTSEIMDFPKKYNLIVEFDSDRGKIKGKEYEKIWNLRKKSFSVLIGRGYYNSEDFKFFFDKLKEFLLYLEFKEVPYIGYLGEGIIHSFFKNYEKDKKEEIINLMQKLGGKFYGGIGLKRKAFVEDFEKKIVYRVKFRYDPFGKLNNGKVIDFEAGMDRRARPLEKEEEKQALVKEELQIQRRDFESRVERPVFEKFVEKGGKDEKKQENSLSPEALLEDYKYTYESELPEKRREKIEEFAKKIPGEIGREENRGKRTKQEEEEINKIIFGGKK